jgi:hypothetical protein
MRLLTLSFLTMLALGSTARADVLQCGNRLVQLGETTGEVELKCGDPAFRDRRTEARGANDQLSTVTIETWTYNLGPHDFIRTLTFVDTRLRNIETGGYGR